MKNEKNSVELRVLCGEKMYTRSIPSLRSVQDDKEWRIKIIICVNL